MKIHFFGILAMALFLVGACHKADVPEVKPNAKTVRGLIQTCNPFVGTWKLYFSQTNPIAEIPGWPQNFLEVVGKDSSQLSYGLFVQNIDSLVIKPNTWFYTISQSGGSEGSIHGDIRVTNSIFIFENMALTYNGSDYPMGGSYYWFITNFTANELDLISPRFYVGSACNMDDMMEQTVLKFERIK